jgi:CBS domain-containing protein
MSTQLYVATWDEPVSVAAALMRDKEVGIIPLVNDRSSMRLVGVITDRDLAVRCVARRHDGSCTISDHMTWSDLVTAHPDEDPADIMERMEHAKIRRVPVVEDGRLVGIIAQADIATKLGRSDPAGVEQLVERISRAAVIPVSDDAIATGNHAIPWL